VNLLSVGRRIEEKNMFSRKSMTLLLVVMAAAFAWNVSDLVKGGSNQLEITITPLCKKNPAQLKGPTQLKWQAREWR